MASQQLSDLACSDIGLAAANKQPAVMINEATIIITLDSQCSGEDNYEPLLRPSVASLTEANDSYQSVVHGGAGLHVSSEDVTPTDTYSSEYLQVVDTDAEVVNNNTGTDSNVYLQVVDTDPEVVNNNTGTDSNVYLQVVDSNTGTDDTEYRQVVESSEDTQINNYNSTRQSQTNTIYVVSASCQEGDSDTIRPPPLPIPRVCCKDRPALAEEENEALSTTDISFYGLHFSR